MKQLIVGILFLVTTSLAQASSWLVTCEYWEGLAGSQYFNGTFQVQVNSSISTEYVYVNRGAGLVAELQPQVSGRTQLRQELINACIPTVQAMVNARSYAPLTGSVRVNVARYQEIQTGALFGYAQIEGMTAPTVNVYKTNIYVRPPIETCGGYSRNGFRQLCR